MSRWGILLLLAWGLALFNAGRALGAVPTDWFGFAVSAIVVIGAPGHGHLRLGRTLMVKRYAEGTSVSVESSRGEISGILAKHGVVRQAWMSEPEADTLHFELAGYQYRFRIEKPTQKSLYQQWKDDGDRSTKWLPNDNQVAAEWRRRWRAHVLLLKAKLEFATGDVSTVLRELMPYAVLRDGRTLEEAIIAGDGIALLPAKSS